MHTGDLAVMDDDGYLNISGRIKDMVIRGGENIYPREIEEFLYTHPDIADVQVIGVPDASTARSSWPGWCCEQGAVALDADGGPGVLRAGSSRTSRSPGTCMSSRRSR